MPTTKRHGPSPREVTEVHTPGALDALPDNLPDARLLVPEPPVDELMRPFRALACAVVTQAMADLARQAVEDLDAALEALENLSTSEPWGISLAWLGMESDTLCEALARRLERGETLTISRTCPKTIHAEAAAAD